MAPRNHFGAYLRELRRQRGLTLRRFCLQNGLDPGNYSKLERGRLPPPGRERLADYARYFGLAEGSDEWANLFDLASADRGRIPEDLMTDEELVRKLPLVFRTLRGEKLTPEQLRELAETIRRV